MESKVSSERLIFKPRNRQAALSGRQRLKMARSAHAYVRGSTVKFYEWLSSDSGKRVPKGPPIWICGDCHLGNLGPVADAKGHITIAIRDLDQTVIGNPAHDLIRLGLSMATAIRGSDLPGVTTALVLEKMVEGYTDALRQSGRRRRPSGTTPKAIDRILEDLHSNADGAIWLKNESRTSPRGFHWEGSFWPLTPIERDEIENIFNAPEVCRLITSHKSRDDDDRVEVLDAAYWVKGCSSLGRLRFAIPGRNWERSSARRTVCAWSISKKLFPPLPRGPAQTKCPEIMPKESFRGRECFLLISGRENASLAISWKADRSARTPASGSET